MFNRAKKRVKNAKKAATNTLENIKEEVKRTLNNNAQEIEDLDIYGNDSIEIIFAKINLALDIFEKYSQKNSPKKNYDQQQIEQLRKAVGILKIDLHDFNCPFLEKQKEGREEESKIILISVFDAIKAPSEDSLKDLKMASQYNTSRGVIIAVSIISIVACMVLTAVGAFTANPIVFGAGAAGTFASVATLFSQRKYMDMKNHVGDLHENLHKIITPKPGAQK